MGRINRMMHMRYMRYLNKTKLVSSLLVLTLMIGTSGFLFVRSAYGATKCWTGQGTTNNWSDTGNWAGGSLPGTGDVATFHGASCTAGTPDKDVTIDQNVTLNTSGGGINIGSNYSGTITQGSGFTITLGSNGWTQAGGTFTGGDSTITLNNASGAFLLTGGTFSNTSGTMNLQGNLTVSGGTFNNTGTVDFSVDSSSITQTLTCSGTFPGTVTDTQSVLSDTLVISSGCSVTFATNVTTTGSITNNGDLTATNITLQGSFNTASGTINISGTTTFSLASGPGTQTLTCIGSFPGTVNDTQSVSTDTFVISGGCSVTFAANVTTSGSITNNGTLTATNITLSAGNFTQNGTFTSSGTTTFSVASGPATQTLTCSGTFSGSVNDTQSVSSDTLVISSGCRVTFVSNVTTTGSITNNGTLIANNITLSAGNFTQNGTFSSSGTTTFSAAFGSATQTLTCSGTFSGAVNDTQSVASDTFVISSGCKVTLSSSVTAPGSITNNGTLYGTTLTIGTNFTQNGTATITTTLTFNGSTSNSTFNCAGPTYVNALVINKTSTGTTTFAGTCDVYGNFTRTDGVVSNSGSAATVHVKGNVSLATTDAFGGTNLTIDLNGTTGSQTLTNTNGVTFGANLSISKNSAGSLTLSSNLTMGSGADVTINSGLLVLSSFNLASVDVLTINGQLNQTTSNISATTITVGTTGIWTNPSTGDITVGAGGVTNDGYVRLDGTSGQCGDADAIAISSDSGGTQRDWAGTGTSLLYDLTVTDMTGSVTAYSSTFSNSTWTDGGECPAYQNRANVSIGNSMNLRGGVNLRSN